MGMGYPSCEQTDPCENSTCPFVRRTQAVNMRNSFYRAKLVNVRDSALMCFTIPVGPTDLPRFFSLYWIPQICKHNWSESFNTREGTWPSLGFYKSCIQKYRDEFFCRWSVCCGCISSHSHEKFSLFSFLLLVKRKIFLSAVFIPSCNKPPIWWLVDFAIRGCFCWIKYSKSQEMVDFRKQ